MINILHSLQYSYYDNCTIFFYINLLFFSYYYLKQEISIVFHKLKITTGKIVIGFSLLEKESNKNIKNNFYKTESQVLTSVKDVSVKGEFCFFLCLFEQPEGLQREFSPPYMIQCYLMPSQW